jgi:hypothetical protein
MSSKAQWEPVTDVHEFLNQRGNKRVRDGHSLKGRILHWPYCEHCGLIALKNDVTRRALKAQCVVWE